MTEDNVYFDKIVRWISESMVTKLSSENILKLDKGFMQK